MASGIKVIQSFILLSSMLANAAGTHFADDVVFVILSQRNSYHVNRVSEKREIWSDQLREMSPSSSSQPRILLSHELALDEAPWTIAPLLSVLSPYIPSTSWFMFALEQTDIHFSELETVLARFDPHEEVFLGHSLQDSTRTILHHYAKENLLHYPHFPSGWVLSTAALDKAFSHVSKFNPSFNIDPQYEFAQFLLYLRTLPVQEMIPLPPPPPGGGIRLTHVPEFCLTQEEAVPCATTYQHSIPECGGEVELKDVHFAVKTCSQFHSSRLPVLEATWAGDAGTSLVYYSDIEDSTHSTVNLGVPNTERGHCGKTEAIIMKFFEDSLLERHVYRWLVIADDDTLLSVPRLLRLLKCYNSSHPILLGEVYDYLAHQPGGTSYVTGGGSMVLSQAAVSRFVNSANRCPSIDSPDDMFLGSVAAAMNWDVVHSPLFHQAQPDSFQEQVLSQQTSISFHRHNPKDPIEVYRHYLSDKEREGNYHSDKEREGNYLSDKEREGNYLSDKERDHSEIGGGERATDREHNTMLRHKTEL